MSAKYVLKKWLRNGTLLYIVFAALVVIFLLLSSNMPDIYRQLIQYFQYPLYILALIVGFHIPYRLFKRYEYKEPRSDLELWLWKIFSSLIAFGAFILWLFGILFLFSALIAKVGTEIGITISIFFSALSLGTTAFAAYLRFKYLRRSGIIIHRGEGW